MSKHKETMSNVDTAWLQMDRPTNLMMIASFMTFDEPIDYERLLATIERRLLIFDRFRQRVVPPRIPFGNYAWEDDPHFDIRAHVHRAALPAPGDKAALQAMMSDIISTPLDRSRPLWHYYLLDGYKGGSVIACRLHHSIADGIALMRVLLSMTDLTPAVSYTHLDVYKRQGSSSGRRLTGTKARMLRLSTGKLWSCR